MRATAAPDLSSYSYSGTGYVTSDANMNVAQWLDYAPYGSVIATTNSGATAAARGYIGQFSDLSGLSYLNARYYSGAQGQFTSQDPTFLALGNPIQLQQISQQDQQRFLSDPQQMNSYSYSENNPIVKSDPSGKFAPALAPVAYGLADLGLASTIEFWGPPVLIGAGVAALGVGAYSLYHDKDFTTSIEVNGGTNETDLPNKTPNDPRGKIIFGALSVTALIVYAENYFGNAGQAGNDYGGLATYTLMPHPVMVNNLSGNGAPINQKSTGPSSNGSGGGSSGSSASLIGLYQSLVATLTALVSVLSASKK
jgi:RHS repeat-associated protein